MKTSAHPLVVRHKEQGLPLADYKVIGWQERGDAKGGWVGVPERLKQPKELLMLQHEPTGREILVFRDECESVAYRMSSLHDIRDLLVELRDRVATDGEAYDAELLARVDAMLQD